VGGVDRIATQDQEGDVDRDEDAEQQEDGHIGEV